MADSNTTTTSLLRTCAGALAVIGAVGAWLAQRELWPPAAVLDRLPAPDRLDTATLVPLTWALLLLGCAMAGFSLLRLILSVLGAKSTPANGATDMSWSAPLLAASTVTGCAVLSILAANAIAPVTFSVPALAGTCLAGLTALVALAQSGPAAHGAWSGLPRLRRTLLLALLLPGAVLQLSLLLMEAVPENSVVDRALATVVMAWRSAWFNYTVLLLATAFLLWLSQTHTLARHRRAARALWFTACTLFGLPMLYGALRGTWAQVVQHLSPQVHLPPDFLTPPAFLCVVLGASLLAFCAGFFTFKPQGRSA